MVVCTLVTFAASDTGYSLKDLLIAAGYQFSLTQIPRFASIKLGYNGSNDAYLVPKAGAYATTVGNVPDNYGYDFEAEGTFFEMAYPQNSISLDEIILGGIAGDSIIVFGYSI